MRDDPIISRIEATGYGGGYSPRREAYFLSPDGEIVERDEFAEHVKQIALDDPQWVAECLGYEWRTDD